jgi:hypothetical protein
MATPSTLARPLPTSAKIFFQLQLPVPWYIYHDRFDTYIEHSETTVSVVVFDLSLDPTTKKKLIVGAAKIPLPETDEQTDTEWINLYRIHGWHRSPGPIKDFVYVTGQRHPSTNYRSIIAGGQYKVQSLPEGSRHVQIKLKSLIGKGHVDNNTVEGQNQVPEGQGLFEFTVKKADDGNGWNLVGISRIEIQDDVLAVDW